MAVFKCKMCGGTLEITENQSLVTCEFCGTGQTLPKFNDERKVTLFTRANHLRFNCEFDKAAGVYESIVTEFPDEAEAYWGLVLCKYGIEYVDDNKGKKIPTCHRTLPVSIMEDKDFLSACDYADTSSKLVYREEAKVIDGIQKKILQIASTEKPYDIFICYKETDENTGARTEDSAIAQDIYTELIKEGYKVFFSRVTLREVAGTEYEPYIYAALSSAKIMLAIGTKFEYYDAVWVKNEWSRFISMMADNSSKALIPCYRNMDAYDIPKEFKNMQALDMGDVTFFASLTANINRLLPKEKKSVNETVVINSGNTQIESLLKRAFMFLEDGDFARADDFCEQVLNTDPECAQAYLGKLMAELGVNKKESLKNLEKPFDKNNNYQKAIRFADEKLKATLTGYIEHINTRNENARIESVYCQAKAKMGKNTEQSLAEAITLFKSIKAYRDSAALIEECIAKKETVRKDNIYDNAVSKMNNGIISDYKSAIKLFESISGWKDADEQIKKCLKKIKEIESRIDEEKKNRKRKEKRKKTIITISSSVVAVIIVFVIVLNTIIINGKYNDAIALMEQGKYQEAILAFEAMKGYRDSAQKAEECNIVILDGKYNNAINLMNKESYREAIAIFGELDDYEDSKDHFSSILKIIAVKDTISAGYEHTVGLKSDGTVVATEYKGNNDFYDGQCDVEGWTDIVAISANDYHTVGLKSDGTVVATEYEGGKDRYCGQCDVEGWTDIVAISAGYSHTVGLKSDGTVVAVGYNGSGQCDVKGWTDIVAISAGSSHTVGLKSDGTVVAVGDNGYGKCDVEGWTDVVAISAGREHTVSLKSDGTVVAVGYNDYDLCNVEGWTDIVAISAG